MEDLEPLPTYLIPVINNIIKDLGFINFEYKLSPGSTHADGFVAIIARITIEGIRNGKPDHLKLICKYPPENKIRRETFGIMIAFEREVIAYKDVLPTFMEFQLEKGLTTASGLGWWTFPKCYYANYDAKTENSAVLLEDLCNRGLIMENKKNPSNYEQTKTIMKELGKFHALSFALKIQKPELYEKFLPLTDSQVKSMDNPMMHNLMQQNFEKALGVLLPSETELIEKFLKFNKTLWSEMKRYTSVEIAGSYATLVHSDCWINNVMFRYNENGDIVDCNLFDWQFASIGSPAIDIIIYIFCSTDKNMRDKHYNDLINFYYEEFSKLLKIFGEDPVKVFPFDALQAQLQKVGGYGLALSLFAVPVLTSDHVPDLNEMSESLNRCDANPVDIVSMNSEENYKERMRGVILDALKYKFI